jgi:DNA-binding response OmpR family regulator
MHRLLLIGTNRQNCQSISQTLWALGFGVDVAYDAQTGLFLAGRRAYSHIVIEHELGHTDGVTVFRRIQPHQREAVGVLLTAAANLNIVFSAMMAGMKRIVSLPVSYAELLPALDPSLHTASDPQSSRWSRGPQLESRIAALSQRQICSDLPDADLIEIIRNVDYPFAGKERLEHFDRDTLERVVHLVCRWCRQRLRLAQTRSEAPASTELAVG